MDHTARVPTTTDFERMLRGATLRVTRPRVAVLTAVYEDPHADTDAIIGVVREDLGEVSHQAVYDLLRALPPTHLRVRSARENAPVDALVAGTPCHGFELSAASTGAL